MMVNEAGRLAFLRCDAQSIASPHDHPGCQRCAGHVQTLDAGLRPERTTCPGAGMHLDLACVDWDRVAREPDDHPVDCGHRLLVAACSARLADDNRGRCARGHALRYRSRHQDRQIVLVYRVLGAGRVGSDVDPPARQLVGQASVLSFAPDRQGELVVGHDHPDLLGVDVDHFGADDPSR